MPDFPYSFVCIPFLLLKKALLGITVLTIEKFFCCLIFHFYFEARVGAHGVIGQYILHRIFSNLQFRRCCQCLYVSMQLDVLMFKKASTIQFWRKKAFECCCLNRIGVLLPEKIWLTAEMGFQCGWIDNRGINIFNLLEDGRFCYKTCRCWLVGFCCQNCRGC